MAQTSNSNESELLTVGLAQIAPVWLDYKQTLAKILDYVVKATEEQCQIVVFGEALLPGYPFWIELTDGARFNSPIQKEIHAHYMNQAVQIEAGHLDSLCNTAAANKIAVVLGCIERAGDRARAGADLDLRVVGCAGREQRELVAVIEIGDGRLERLQLRLEGVELPLLADEVRPPLVEPLQRSCLGLQSAFGVRGAQAGVLSLAVGGRAAGLGACRRLRFSQRRPPGRQPLHACLRGIHRQAPHADPPVRGLLHAHARELALDRAPGRRRLVCRGRPLRFRDHDGLCRGRTLRGLDVRGALAALGAQFSSGALRGSGNRCRNSVGG